MVAGGRAEKLGCGVDVVCEARELPVGRSSTTEKVPVAHTPAAITVAVTMSVRGGGQTSAVRRRAWPNNPESKLRVAAQTHEAQ